jgi:hypothetical protein
LLPPKQDTGVAVAEAVTAVGCVTTAVADEVHPFASITVTVYVPAVRPVAVAVVWLLIDHRYVIGAVPPVAVAVALPLLPPAQETFTTLVVTVGPLRLITVAEAVFVQPLASVTVTVYVPAERFAIVAVVAPGALHT